MSSLKKTTTACLIERKNASLHLNSHQSGRCGWLIGCECVGLCRFRFVLKIQYKKTSAGMKKKKQLQSHDTVWYSSFELQPNPFKAYTHSCAIEECTLHTSYLSMRIKSATRSNLLQSFTVVCVPRNMHVCVLQFNSQCVGYYSFNQTSWCVFFI